MPLTTCLGFLPNSTLAGESYFACLEGGTGTKTNGEAQGQVTYRTPVVVSRLRMVVQTNTLTATTTITLRKNGADGANVLSIGSGATGTFEDTTNTDSFAAGDLCAVHVVAGATGTSILFGNIASTKDYGPGLVGRHFGSTRTADRSFSTASQINPFAMTTGDTLLEGAVEANTQSTWVGIGGAFQNIYVRVTSNARTTSVTFTTRVDGGNGVLLVALAAFTSGIVEETTIREVPIVGKLYNLALVTGTGTEVLKLGACRVEFLAQLVPGTPMTAALLQGQSGPRSAGTTAYEQFSNPSGLDSTIEAAHQLKNLDAIAVTNFICYISVNTITATTNLRTRVDGNNGVLLLAIGSSATGIFRDDVGLDMLAPGNLVVTQFAVPNNGTSLTLRVFSCAVTWKLPSIRRGFEASHQAAQW